MDATADMVMNKDRLVHWALRGYFPNDYCFATILMGLVILSYRVVKSQTLARLSGAMAVHRNEGEEYWLGDDETLKLLDLVDHLL
jgi:hypothetical protein